MTQRVAVLIAFVALAGCHGAAPSRSAAPTPAVRADASRPRFTEADVHFISGMIGHHAQALVMAGWAPTHDASPTIRTLCERIIVSQRDEIGWMQNWLRDRGQPVPDATPNAMAAMPGMDHGDMLMPGMLTTEQMTQLDRARGADFDRAFLRFMIQHHQGALTMVNQLFGTAGAAQTDDVYKIASDISADQTSEIDRMTRMLDQMSGGRN
jgi:uncharacterized protein (DUF305 family)